MIISVLVCIFLFSNAGQTQGVTPGPAQNKEELVLLGYQYLNKNNLSGAVAVAEQIQKLDPKDPRSYFFMIQACWRKRLLRQIVWLVYDAERDHGVRDLNLYREQAMALYLLGGYDAVFQVLDKIQDLLSKPADVSKNP